MSSHIRADWCPTTLIIGPGGVKGFMQVGALAALEKISDLRKIKRVIGVSVGSVISLLLATGYKPSEIACIALGPGMTEEIFRTNLELGHGFFSNGGFISVIGIEKTLNELLIKKLGKSPTLKELYDITGIELWAVSTNLTDLKAAYLSLHTYPNLSCVQAILASINIPFVFQYQEIDGKRYIDGAFSDPMPIGLFPEEDQLVIRIVDEINCSLSVFQYFYASITVPMEIITKQKIETMMATPGFASRCRIMELKTKELNPINTRMTEDEKQCMLKEGIKIAIESAISGLLSKQDAENSSSSHQPLSENKRNVPIHLSRNLRGRLSTLP